MSTNLLQDTALLGCAILLLGSSSAAQESATADSAKLRERCEFASKTLESGHPDPHSKWAINFIRLCPGSAGTALAAQWGSESGLSAVGLNDLVFSSQQVRDQRVFDAAAATARSSAAPTSMRLGALQVLASYADPIVAVSLDDLEHPDTAAHLRVAAHVFSVFGAVPPDTNVRARALALFSTLAANESDAGVRAAATYLSREFGPAHP